MSKPSSSDFSPKDQPLQLVADALKTVADKASPEESVAWNKEIDLLNTIIEKDAQQGKIATVGSFEESLFNLFVLEKNDPEGLAAANNRLHMQSTRDITNAVADGFVKAENIMPALDSLHQTNNILFIADPRNVGSRAGLGSDKLDIATNHPREFLNQGVPELRKAFEDLAQVPGFENLYDSVADGLDSLEPKDGDSKRVLRAKAKSYEPLWRAVETISSLNAPDGMVRDNQRNPTTKEAIAQKANVHLEEFGAALNPFLIIDEMLVDGTAKNNPQEFNREAAGVLLKVAKDAIDPNDHDAQSAQLLNVLTGSANGEERFTTNAKAEKEPISVLKAAQQVSLGLNPEDEKKFKATAAVMESAKKGANSKENQEALNNLREKFGREPKEIELGLLDKIAEFFTKFAEGILKLFESFSAKKDGKESEVRDNSNWAKQESEKEKVKKEFLGANNLAVQMAKSDDDLEMNPALKADLVEVTQELAEQNPKIGEVGSGQEKLQESQVNRLQQNKRGGGVSMDV